MTVTPGLGSILPIALRSPPRWGISYRKTSGTLRERLTRQLPQSSPLTVPPGTGKTLSAAAWLRSKEIEMTMNLETLIKRLSDKLTDAAPELKRLDGYWE